MKTILNQPQYVIFQHQQNAAFLLRPSCELVSHFAIRDLM